MILKDYLINHQVINYLESYANETDNVSDTVYRLYPFTPRHIPSKKVRDPLTNRTIGFTTNRMASNLSEVQLLTSSVCQNVSNKKPYNSFKVQNRFLMQANTSFQPIASPNKYSMQPAAVIPAKTGITYHLYKIDFTQDLSGYYIDSIEIGYGYGEAVQDLLTCENTIQFIIKVVKDKLKDILVNKSLQLTLPFELAPFIPESFTLSNLGVTASISAETNTDIQIQLHEYTYMNFFETYQYNTYRFMDFYYYQSTDRIVDGELTIHDHLLFDVLQADFGDSIQETNGSGVTTYFMLSPLSETRTTAIQQINKQINLVDLGFDLALGIPRKNPKTTKDLTFECECISLLYFDLINLFGTYTQSLIKVQTGQSTLLDTVKKYVQTISSLITYNYSVLEIKDIFYNSFKDKPSYNLDLRDILKIYNSSIDSTNINTPNIFQDFIAILYAPYLHSVFSDRGVYSTINSFGIGNYNASICLLTRQQRQLQLQQFLKYKFSSVQCLLPHNQVNHSVFKRTTTYLQRQGSTSDTYDRSKLMTVSIANITNLYSYVQTTKDDITICNLNCSNFFSDKLKFKLPTIDVTDCLRLYNYPTSCALQYTTDITINNFKFDFVNKDMKTIPIVFFEFNNFADIFTNKIKTLIPELLYDITDIVNLEVSDEVLKLLRSNKEIQYGQLFQEKLYDLDIGISYATIATFNSLFTDKTLSGVITTASSPTNNKATLTLKQVIKKHTVNTGLSSNTNNTSNYTAKEIDTVLAALPTYLPDISDAFNYIGTASLEEHYVKQMNIFYTDSFNIKERLNPIQNIQSNLPVQYTFNIKHFTGQGCYWDKDIVKNNKERDILFLKSLTPSHLHFLHIWQEDTRYFIIPCNGLYFLIRHNLKIKNNYVSKISIVQALYKILTESVGDDNGNA